MKDFRPPARARFSDFPRWICSATEPSCGHVCGLTATHVKPWASDGSYFRVYCEGHAPEGAQAIPADTRFVVTRIELRVAVASLPGDLDDAAVKAVRAVSHALDGAGAAIVGIHVKGGTASETPLEASPLRLQLAGRAEPAVRGDRPFWGVLGEREWPFWRRRRA